MVLPLSHAMQHASMVKRIRHSAINSLATSYQEHLRFIQMLHLILLLEDIQFISLQAQSMLLT